MSSNRSCTLLSIFNLLGDVLDKLLLFGPFLVFQSKGLVLEENNKQKQRPCSWFTCIMYGLDKKQRLESSP